MKLETVFPVFSHAQGHALQREQWQHMKRVAVREQVTLRSLSSVGPAEGITSQGQEIFATELRRPVDTSD